MLDPVLSRARQNRLLNALADEKLDAFVVGYSPHVYYLSTFLTSWIQQSAMIVYADGSSCLICAAEPSTPVAADEVMTYKATWGGTQRLEQPSLVADLVVQKLKSKKSARIGIDASIVSSQIALQSDAEIRPIDSALRQLRRVKDADELRLMQKGIACTEAMYARAKKIIEPGVNELRVCNELLTVAVETAGETLSTILGNDFKCGGGGGMPRDRAAKAGELYILDLGPVYRGYFADNARTFAVDRKPTDAQTKVWQAIVDVFPIVEAMAKPGARCRDIVGAVDEHLDRHLGQGLPHHLGHGVGLQPHEYPHLNPKYNETLVEGEFFTAEPGIYGPELGGGMRIENNYLVTSAGVRRLNDFPMELS